MTTIPEYEERDALAQVMVLRILNMDCDGLNGDELCKFARIVYPTKGHISDQYIRGAVLSLCLKGEVDIGYDGKARIHEEG